ncbi:LlaJI family restriction endonuclease [Ursidibacter arcticus]
MDNDLLKFCQNATEREDFIGIYFDFDETLQINRPYITFPYGYHFSTNDDILCLIKVLSNYQNENQEFGISTNNHNGLGFPIYSYIFIIQDYLKNGYYYERETVYKRQNNGKINWGRTIKKEQAIAQNNGTIYLTMQAKTHQYSDEYLMTQISQYCVYESFVKMGWFYGLSLPTKPNYKLNKAIFTATLQEKLSKTNKDFDKQLFQSMLNVLNCIDEHQNNAQYFTFGTRRFEKIWEYLIDKAFGTEFGEQKIKYFPKASWQLNYQADKSTNSLYPDTIGINDNMIYIIDAKYYRYGISKNPLHLPNISSIAKQITYAEYIDSKQFNFSKIKNVFILPFNAKLENNHFYTHIGFAVADWINDKHGYKYIDTILVDCQYLMKHYQNKQLHHLHCWLNPSQNLILS